MTEADLPDFSLRGRRALVTGSTRGIGFAIASAFAAAGASVAVNGPTEDAELRDAAARSGATAGVAADLSRPDEVDRLAERTQAELGGVDILVLNAAWQIRAGWSAIDPADFDLQLEINLKAGYRLIQLLAPEMAERGWGRLIAIGSIQEAKEHPEMLVYAASKAAQTSMMRNLARQLASQGVTCNTLAPGVIETDRNREALADPIYREQVRARIPAGFFGQPSDCAGAALFLASDAGRYVTGSLIFVDGGMHL